jgi:beta-glucosidase
LKTVVAPKHYIVHSGPEGGRHSFNAKVNSKDLYDTYMPAFKASVVDGKVGSMLASFNAINFPYATIRNPFSKSCVA